MDTRWWAALSGDVAVGAWQGGGPSGGDAYLWLLFTGVMVWLVMRQRARRRSQDTTRALFAGYRKLDRAHLMPEQARLALDGGRWEVLRVEDIPMQQRRRVVMSIGFAPASLALESLERLLWRLAASVQQKVHAHVVVVEAFERARQAPLLAGQGRARLLFAADGRGWSGAEDVLAVLEEREGDARLYDLAEVQRRVRAADEG